MSKLIDNACVFDDGMVSTNPLFNANPVMWITYCEDSSTQDAQHDAKQIEPVCVNGSVHTAQQATSKGLRSNSHSQHWDSLLAKNCHCVNKTGAKCGVRRYISTTHCAHRIFGPSTAKPGQPCGFMYVSPLSSS